LKEAASLGCVFWDTSNVYGNGHNETLISRVLPELREKVFICTKFGIEHTAEGISLHGDREYVHKA